ncbi:MAG: C1 family peptidase [Polyangiaceae bacterium]
MKTLRYISMFTLAATLAVACGEGPSSRPMPRYPAAPGRAYSPYGMPPHAPAAHTGPSRAPRWLPPPAPAPAVFRPINVGGLLAALAQSPCAPVEVSPGNWVGMDCSLPTLITRATSFVRPQQFITGPLPTSVDHRAIGMEGPIKSQGSVGTCTAVSLSTAMEHALRRVGATDNVSALHIWSQYKVPRMGTAGNSNVDKRLASSTIWPYDPAVACKMLQRPGDSCGIAYGVFPGSADGDPQIVSKKAAADAAGRYRLVGIEKIGNHDPQHLASLIAGGDDLWVAFNMNSTAWRSRAMVNNVIQDYVPAGRTGHAVVLAGYRSVGFQKQFLIHNSWGSRWGNNGYAWISENMVRNQLRYAYRVRVADPAAPPPAPGQPPAPGPSPSAGACPAGQATDLIYRRCAPACAGGGPPAAGLCAPPLPGYKPPATPPPASGGACPSGQARDLISGQCAAACPGGLPALGGMCLPRL